MNTRIKKFTAYILTSLATAVVDIGIFYLTLKELEIHKYFADIFLATVVARAFSTIVGYQLNSKFVFKAKERSHVRMVKHLLLSGSQMLLSGFLLTLIDNLLKSNTVIEKMFVDSFLFVVYYFAQKHWVFKDHSH